MSHLLIYLICLHTPVLGNEPEALTSLRDGWVNSLKKGEKKVREDTLARLRRQQQRFIATDRYEQARPVEKEIKTFQGLSSGTRSIPTDRDENPPSSIKFSRALFSKKMNDLIKKESKSYRSELSTLHARLTAKNEARAAEAVKVEIARLDNGEALTIAGFGDQRKIIADLDTYLTGSNWFFSDHTTGDEGKITFEKGHGVAMYGGWWRGTWKVTSKNQVSISHTTGDWKFELTLSDDRKTMEGRVTSADNEPMTTVTGKKIPAP